ncbi:MAG: hypothetical protein V1793_24510 [Pseudomonadota bacterium]
MGLFSFFSKKPEQHETTGDSLFARDAFGPAKIEYEKALAILAGNHSHDPELKPRILKKMAGTREALARQHLDRADEYSKEGLEEDALTFYSLALELTGDEDKKQHIQSAIKRIHKRVKLPLMEEPDEQESLYEEEADPGDESDIDEFYAICGTYPDEIAEAYQSYGEDFRDGLLALSRGDDAGAVESFELALDQCQEPEHYIALELSRALVHLGQFERAEDLLGQFLSWNPLSLTGISRMCDVYAATERFSLALDLIHTLPPDIQNTRDCRLLEGAMYMGAKDYPGAESVYRRFLSLNDWEDAMARALAATLEAMGRLDEAKATIVSLLSACTGCGRRPRPEDQLFFADISLKTGDYSKKLMDIYHKVAMENPEYAPHCLGQTAKILRHAGETAEATRLEAMAETASGRNGQQV